MTIPGLKTWEVFFASPKCRVEMDLGGASPSPGEFSKWENHDIATFIQGILLVNIINYALLQCFFWQDPILRIIQQKNFIMSSF